VHERIAHVLDARQRVLEPLPCLAKHTACRRVDAKRLQGRLLESFRGEELPAGEDELPRVDLTGAEGRAVVVAVPDMQDREFGGAQPPL
jgi:hypothetical protein